MNRGIAAGVWSAKVVFSGVGKSAAEMRMALDAGILCFTTYPVRRDSCSSPGRLLLGNAGALLTRVEYLKRGEARNFAIVDTAMNDLVRCVARHNCL